MSKEVVMKVRFQSDMPAMPSQGYGVGSPANSNQDWYAADVVGEGMTPGTQKFTPNKWAKQAQLVNDWRLQMGKAQHNTGWESEQQASDLTHHMFTAQGRYQASMPGTSAHAMVENYKASERDKIQEKREQVIGHLDKFAGNLQTAATSLAYLTGASGGLSTALSRAGSVFAAFQGIGGIAGMGGTSLGGMVHGAGSMIGSAGALGGIGLGALGIGAGAAAVGMNANNIVEGLSGRKVDRADHWDRVGGGAEQGSSRNVVAQVRSDWNQWKARTFGGGYVNNMGDFVSQERQQEILKSQAALRLNSFTGQHSLQSTRIGLEGQQWDLAQNYVNNRSQYMGYAGYATTVGAGDQLGGRTTQHMQELSAQPRSLVSTMNKLYGNNYQAEGELAMRLQGIQEQARGFATRGAQLEVNMSQVGVRRRQMQFRLDSQRGESADLIKGGATERSGDVQASRQKEVELEQQLIQLSQEEFTIRKQMRENETGILETKRQQAISSAAMLQQAVNTEKQAHDQGMLSFGRQDPGQRAYTKSVLERYKKSGRKGVAPDEMGIVEQFMPREAQADYRDIAKEEGFADLSLKGTKREEAIGAANKELETQKQLVVELSRQLDVKLEMDNEQLSKMIQKDLEPLVKQVIINMSKIASEQMKVAEGVQQIQGMQKVGQ